MVSFNFLWLYKTGLICVKSVIQYNISNTYADVFKKTIVLYVAYPKPKSISNLTCIWFITLHRTFPLTFWQREVN